jgi:hypothetical protein
MRHHLLAVATATGLGLAGLAFNGSAQAADNTTGVTAEQLQELRAQIAALQAQLDTLQQRTDAQS